MKKFLFLFLFFYLLALFQTSLLNFNLILFLVIFINLFEKSQGNLGLYSAFMGGLFLDIFSEKFLGFQILILLLIAFLIKMILRRYIQLPIFFK